MPDTMLLFAKRNALLYLIAMTAAWLVLPSLSFAFDDEDEDEPFSAPVVEELITVNREHLMYQGKKVPVPFTRKKLIEVFGPPTREIYNAAGTVVIWDDIGLTCYGCHKLPETPEEFHFMTKEEKQSVQNQPYVNSITLFVRKYNPYPEHEKRYSHEPRNPFQGKLDLSGVELDGSLTFAEFLELRKGKQTILLPENAFSFYINCQPEPHEVTLHTIRDKYDVDFMSIHSISIRNIGHYYRYYKCTEVFDAKTSAEKVKKSITEEPKPPPSEPAPGPEPTPKAKQEPAQPKESGVFDSTSKQKVPAKEAKPMEAPQPVEEELLGPPIVDYDDAQQSQGDPDPEANPPATIPSETKPAAN